VVRPHKIGQLGLHNLFGFKTLKLARVSILRFDDNGHQVCNRSVLRAVLPFAAQGCDESLLFKPESTCASAAAAVFPSLESQKPAERIVTGFRFLRSSLEASSIFHLRAQKSGLGCLHYRPVLSTAWKPMRDAAAVPTRPCNMMVTKCLLGLPGIHHTDLKSPPISS
jgi:hypothetical protein